MSGSLNDTSLDEDNRAYGCGHGICLSHLRIVPRTCMKGQININLCRVVCSRPAPGKATSEEARRYVPHFVWPFRPFNRSWQTEKPLQCFRSPKNFSST